MEQTIKWLILRIARRYTHINQNGNFEIHLVARNDFEKNDYLAYT